MVTTTYDQTSYYYRLNSAVGTLLLAFYFASFHFFLSTPALLCFFNNVESNEMLETQTQTDVCGQIAVF